MITLCCTYFAYKFNQLVSDTVKSPFKSNPNYCVLQNGTYQRPETIDHAINADKDNPTSLHFGWLKQRNKDRTRKEKTRMAKCSIYQDQITLQLQDGSKNRVNRDTATMRLGRQSHHLYRRIGTWRRSVSTDTKHRGVDRKRDDAPIFHIQSRRRCRSTT